MHHTSVLIVDKMQYWKEGGSGLCIQKQLRGFIYSCSLILDLFFFNSYQCNDEMFLEFSRDTYRAVFSLTFSICFLKIIWC